MLSRLLNMRRMADDLKEHLIGRGEFYCYAGFFVLAFAYSIALLLNIANPFEETYVYDPAYLRQMENILGFGGTIAMVWIAWATNKAGDNSDFWYRYMSLSFPIAIWTLIAAFILGILGVIVGLIDVEVVGYADIFLQCALLALILYWTRKYMARIAQPAQV
jgi:hypothetical protein